MATVLITQDSRRVFQLMEEDCIELSFSLAEAVHFMVGDWCDDELFGRFYVCEEQMPAWNERTGGYDYSLRLEAPYMLLRNKVHTLPAVVTSNVNTPPLVRKETHWMLTGTLEDHARVVVDNARLSGVDCFNAVEGGVYPLEITAEKALEHKCITYGGVSVLEALRLIADAYETEWWVAGGVLHLGKCEGEGDPYLFELGRNVERMGVQNDVQDYCNAVFAFGGTQNVPSSYRRSLEFEVSAVMPLTMTRVAQTVDGFYDGAKRVTLGMLHGGGGNVALGNPRTTVSDASSFTALLDGTLTLPYASECAFAGSLTFHARLRGSARGSVRMRLLAYPSGGESVEVASTTDSAVAGPLRMQLPVDVSLELPRGSYTLRLLCDVAVDAGSEGTLEFIGTRSLASGEAFVSSVAQSCGCLLLYEGQTYPVTFNPNGTDSTDDEYYCFVFGDGSQAVDAPEGFGLGSAYRLLFFGETHEGTVVTEGLEVTEVPLSWFTRDYDNPSSLWSIGENRLMLPVGAASEDYDIDGSRIARKGLSAGQTVERTVVWDGVHPRCVLVVTEVSETQRRDREEYEDGSQTAWQWTQYRVRCKTLSGEEFPFRETYCKPGETLRMRFMSENDAGTTAGAVAEDFGLAAAPSLLLQGMEFEVEFNGATQEYTLLRNDGYGPNLPNETLRPTVGDFMTLVGWDVRAMSSLGLVESAEEELLAQAVEYLEAMDEGQFVFTCEMMSEWLFHTEDGWVDLRSQDGQGGAEDFHDADDRQVRVWHVMPIPFITSEDEPFFAGGRQLWVENDHCCFLLPLEGARVTVVHGALKDGRKTSRVIGYEMKLDKPYDTPRYTIGETEAYSRLKALERKLRVKS